MGECEGYLIKASPERLRPTTYEEELAERSVPELLRQSRRVLDGEVDEQMVFEDLTGDADVREAKDGEESEQLSRGAGIELKRKLEHARKAVGDGASNHVLPGDDEPSRSDDKGTSEGRNEPQREEVVIVSSGKSRRMAEPKIRSTERPPT